MASRGTLVGKESRQAIDRILALDLGTSMGAVVMRFDGYVEHSEAKTFKTDPDARPIALRDYLIDLNRRHGPFEAVAFELPFSMQRNSIAALHELIAVVRLVAHDLQVPYYWVNTATLRSVMGIKARQRDTIKAEIAAWYRREFSHRDVGQDEMDAALVGRWLLATLSRMQAA